MIDLNERLIEEMSYNLKSFKNGKTLALKNDVFNRVINKEEDFIIGSIKGNKEYTVYADFFDATKIDYKCTCSSKQIPCKHATALLYEYFLNKEEFSVEEIDINIEKSRRKNKKIRKISRKEDIEIFKERLKYQLEGIHIIDKFIEEIYKIGVKNFEKETINKYESAVGKKLNMYGLKKDEIIFKRIINILKCGDLEENSNELVLELVRLKITSDKEKEAIEKYIEGNEYIKNEDIQIFKNLSYRFTLEDLKKRGMVEHDLELINLGFVEKRIDEETDIAIIYQLETKGKKIYREIEDIRKGETSILVKYINECTLEGELDFQKIRYEGYDKGALKNKEIEKIFSASLENFEEVIVKSKNKFKNLLIDDKDVEKDDVYLIKYIDIKENLKTLFFRDKESNLIEIKNSEKVRYLIDLDNIKNSVALIRIDIDREEESLRCDVISIISKNGISSV